MPEGDALSLGDIQKRFTDSLQVIEELKGKLTTLAQTELTSAKAGERLQSASKTVEEASSELKSFAGIAKSAIEEFGVAMAEAGRVVQQTTLTELETAVGSVGKLLEAQVDEWKEKFENVESAMASIRSLLESTVVAAQARAEAAEAALAKIPEKYKAKYTR
jgi:FtsZ-binding cell division protein ZapB